MMETLIELAQEAVYEMRHLSTDTEHGLAQDLQRALDNLHQTVALPAADYETRPVTSHPLDTLAMVATFMRTAGQQVKASPGQPTPDVLKLRLNLELEELYEKAQAFGLEGTFCGMLIEKSGVYAAIGLDCGEEVPYLECQRQDDHMYEPIEVLDACVDQRYVQDGTVLACGLQQSFPEAFANVQASNLSKFPISTEQADATVIEYALQGIVAHWERKDGVYTVHRTSDHKVLKSIGYIPASLGPILEKHSGK